jgi:beta-N-acetylhexosaminidase
MKNRKAIIVGLSSTKLKDYEQKFLLKNKPWGVILFTRNIINIDQAKKLVFQIKKCFKDPNYPILIDEEGGRVSRLKRIIDTSLFTSQYFSKIYLNNKKKFFLYYGLYVNSISSILNTIGVNINTVPVLDVRRTKSSNVIGDRSYSSLPKNVSKIGDFCINEFKKKGIGTVIKHIPGHGLAKVDSHKLTPVVKRKMKYLYKNDFDTFKNKKTFFAMTAHVIYNDIYPINTATHSPKIIKLIRKKIGFKNIIISDDISMKGLKYSIKQNLNKALSAGCNLILHCNANYSEMRTVAENSPIIDNFIIQKTSQFYKFLS